MADDGHFEMGLRLQIAKANGDLPSDGDTNPEWATWAQRLLDDAAAYRATQPAPLPTHPALNAVRALVAERDVLLENVEVCLCGCPNDMHESDECGESCGDESHVCIRTCPAIRDLYVALRDKEPAPLEEAVREALARFGAVMLREFWQDGNPGDIDGGAAQEAAEEFGIWHQVERHADGVECEWCGNEGPCGELTEVGLAALAERPAPEAAPLEEATRLLTEVADHLLAMSGGAHNCAGCGLLHKQILAALAARKAEGGE